MARRLRKLGVTYREARGSHRLYRVKDWTVVAPDVHPAHSWGPSLRSASEHIKEAIALVLDLPKGAEKTIVLDAEYQVAGLDSGESDVFRIARDARQGIESGPRKG